MFLTSCKVLDTMLFHWSEAGPVLHYFIYSFDMTDKNKHFFPLQEAFQSPLLHSGLVLFYLFLKSEGECVFSMCAISLLRRALIQDMNI